MAYNRGYSGNPDALPPHAEPDQAAQILTNPGRTSYGAKPPPPPNTQYSSRNEDRYNRPPPPPSYASGAGQSQGGYGGQPQQGAYGQQQGGYNDGRPSSSYASSQHRPGQDQRFGSAGPPPPPPRNQNNNAYTPPPPASYGQGPPPSDSHNRPPIPTAQRPPTTAPPARTSNDRDGLWPLFVAVDKDRSGQLSESSLRRALVNGDYTAFDVHTVKMMIRMFDTDRSGTINFDEFCGLWGFLAAWRNLFDRFDTDRSGNISYSEFSEALVAFGYRLSSQFVQLLFSTYARNVGGRGDDGAGGAGGRERGLSFDLFVQACISLKRMTDVFKKYDEDRDGYITLSFEEFLTGAQSLFLFNSISAVTDTGLY